MSHLDDYRQFVIGAVGAALDCELVDELTTETLERLRDRIRARDRRLECVAEGSAAVLFLHGSGGDIETTNGSVHFSVNWTTGEIVPTRWGLKTYLAAVRGLQVEEGEVEALVGTLPTTSTKS